MEVGNIATLASSAEASQATNAFAALGSQEFLKLLIAQISNQDPLEPMGNAELLAQLSSIREIELSSTLTDTLRELTGQDRFTSASSLIGKYVTSPPGADGLIHRGIVVGVRFAGGGSPLLQLSDGTEVAVENVLTVESPVRAAESLIGQTITGIDRRNPAAVELVEGLVTGVRIEPTGELFLEFDSGDDLRFQDFLSISSVV